jgi:hypothetical protein
MHLVNIVCRISGTAALGAVLWLSMSAAGNVGDALTRNTIRLSLAWYVAALWLIVSLKPADWAAATPRGRLVRWCWTWGTVVYLVHVAMAFQFFHDWSHAQAVEFTRVQSGWGAGIYFNYAFTLLWTGDAAWWWLSPATYAARSRRLHLALHAFMLFIAFNATVVFGVGPIRWAGIVATIALSIAYIVFRSERSVAQQN